jgi:hypothetical protein
MNRLAIRTPGGSRVPRPLVKCAIARRTQAWGCLAMLLAEMASAAAIPHQPRAQAKLERQSIVALKAAGRALKAAHEAYRDDDLAMMSAAVDKFEQEFDLACSFLTQSGENPRENPRYFKEAEIQIRKLSRKLDYLQVQMRYDDQLILEGAKARLQQVDDELVIGLVGGKENKEHPGVVAQN